MGCRARSEPIAEFDLEIKVTPKAGLRAKNLRVIELTLKTVGLLDVKSHGGLQWRKDIISA